MRNGTFGEVLIATYSAVQVGKSRVPAARKLNQVKLERVIYTIA